MRSARTAELGLGNHNFLRGKSHIKKSKNTFNHEKFETMKKLLLLSMILGFAMQVYAQEQKTFKERNIVNLSQAYYKLKKQNDSTIINNVTYNSKGDTLTFQRETIKKKNKEEEITQLVLEKIDLNNSTIRANLIVVDNKIMIYPWKFCDNEQNKFFDNHDVYIKMKDRMNYSYRYSSWQAGAVILPAKIYLKNNLNNIETSLTPMINVGYKIGKSRFVKFPHEDKARQYKTGVSFNGLIGLSKITFNKDNTSLDDPVEGNVGAVSLGSAIGFHYGDFTLMVSSGYDLPFNNRKNWNFKNTPWLGHRSWF